MHVVSAACQVGGQVVCAALDATPYVGPVARVGDGDLHALRAGPFALYTTLAALPSLVFSVKRSSSSTSVKPATAIIARSVLVLGSHHVKLGSHGENWLRRRSPKPSRAGRKTSAIQKVPRQTDAMRCSCGARPWSRAPRERCESPTPWACVPGSSSPPAG